MRAAAKFVPDQEISNKRLAASIAIIFLATASSYIISEALLVNAAPQSGALSIAYIHPEIVVKDGRQYLLVGQTTSGQGSYTGPGYQHLSILFTELLDNGTLRNTVKLADIENGGNLASTSLLTDNGAIDISYRYTTIGFQTSTNSALYFANSTDGIIWSDPVEAYPGSSPMNKPTLLETPEGTLFLLFGVNKWSYITSEGAGWSEPVKAPYESPNTFESLFTYESAFLDRDGHINVIWDAGDVYGNDLGIRYSTLIDGVWSEPKLLTSNSVTMMGQDPRVIYSTQRGGYYLFVTYLKQTGSPNWRPQTQLYFSSDLQAWESLSYFQADEYSIAETPDGGLVRIHRLASSSLMLTKSQNGVDWSDQVNVERYVDAVAVSGGSAAQNSATSYVVSVIAMVTSAVVLVIVQKPGRALHQETPKSGFTRLMSRMEMEP